MQTKMTPKVDLQSTNDAHLPLDEAPGQQCVSRLLGTRMNELWEVLLKCKLAKKRGQLFRIDKEQNEDFRQTNGLTHSLVLGKSNKQPATRLGLAQRDQPEVGESMEK
jgi:hypothetical protein